MPTAASSPGSDPLVPDLNQFLPKLPLDGALYYTGISGPTLADPHKYVIVEDMESGGKWEMNVTLFHLAPVDAMVALERMVLRYRAMKRC